MPTVALSSPPHRNIKLLSIFNFLIGFNLFAPLAIIYFAKVAGSFTLGTSIFGIVMLAAAAFEIPTGMWSDRVGRKQTILFGSLVRFLAFVSYAIGASFWWLVFGAILEGLSRSLFSGNNEALLYDTLAENNKLAEFQEHLGKTSSTEQFALAIAALLGGIVGWHYCCLVIWCGSMVVGIVAIFTGNY